MSSFFSSIKITTAHYCDLTVFWLYSTNSVYYSLICVARSPKKVLTKDSVEKKDLITAEIKKEIAYFTLFIFA